MSSIIIDLGLEDYMHSRWVRAKTLTYWDVLATIALAGVATLAAIWVLAAIGWIQF
jgi:hypothetical protein